MAIDADGHWVAGIGDPSPVGWFTVAAYAVAALLAARNVSAARRCGAPTGFWIALTVLMLLLGINKQLDLQTWFGETGRDLARSQGWYEQRRAVQAAFIVLLGAGVLAALAAARVRLARLWPQYRGAFVGIVVLATFIVIRAASFHHIDEFLGFDVGGTYLGRALEIVGVVAVGVACLRWQWRYVPRALRR